MSNFSFLNTWTEIAKAAKIAEQYVRSDYRSSCFYSRYALELSIQWMYDNDSALVRPAFQATLIDLLNTESFRQLVPTAIQTKAHLIRKQGNSAVHDVADVSLETALVVLIELHHVFYWFARTYGDATAMQGVSFNDAQIPPAPTTIIKHTRDYLRQLDQELKAKDSELREAQAQNSVLQRQLDTLRAKIAARRAVNSRIPDTHTYSEAQTRTMLIDVLLREAGWDVDAPNVREYPVMGMPSPSGRGNVDYVLWSTAGKPLAVVEAKRTSRQPSEGKHQATLYADALERLFHQRPIIFYTNGFTTWLWDDQRAVPRTVQGFLAEDELELLIQRRTLAQDIRTLTPAATIINRPYQHEAVRRVCERLTAGHRRALVVMATGTGKTRVAVALADVLQRAHWAKRILFLADRTTLVEQAYRVFVHHLPHTNPVNLTKRPRPGDVAGSRAVLSTYQTMINMIDTTDTNGQKQFGVGHFDLIILDEVHRSIYDRYGAILQYFDGMIVGLTATPKAAVERSTYQLFDVAPGVPTYAYDLDQAVQDGYLVPYRAYAVTTNFLQSGIRYADLSPEEQEQWELLDWSATDQIPNEIPAEVLNQWLFNNDTVDAIIRDLMEHGIKVQGGDVLGKTIIFAKNHRHAEFIIQRFDAQYPHYQGTFAAVIDYQVQYAQNLIDRFSDPVQFPQIAVSVDMLDTGIDIPDVVNLVFFKIVRSQVKFAQMIGRGTRLRPNLFGPAHDKAEFVIFDACQNFEFFAYHPQGYTAKPRISLNQQLFQRRLTLLQLTQQQTHPEDTHLTSLLKDDLYSYVAAINPENVIVRPKRAALIPFQNRARWDGLTTGDIATLNRDIASLPSQRSEDDEAIKRYDVLMLDLYLAYRKGLEHIKPYQERILALVDHLLHKQNIPMIAAKKSTLDSAKTSMFWEHLNFAAIEALQELRGLMVFVEGNQRQYLYTAFTDEGSGIQALEHEYVMANINQAQYRQQVEQFLVAHRNHEALKKLREGIPLRQHDLLMLEQFFYEADPIGGITTFNQTYGSLSLPHFIRSIIGMDRRAAQAYFARFLDTQHYTADQIQFVMMIIDYLSMNGVIEKSALYEAPFVDRSYLGVEGIFNEQQRQILFAMIDQVNTIVVTA